MQKNATVTRSMETFGHKLPLFGCYVGKYSVNSSKWLLTMILSNFRKQHFEILVFASQPVTWQHLPVTRAILVYILYIPLKFMGGFSAVLSFNRLQDFPKLTRWICYYLPILCDHETANPLQDLPVCPSFLRLAWFIWK